MLDNCIQSESYNPVPGVMEKVPSASDYDGGFASKLMVSHSNLFISLKSYASVLFSKFMARRMLHFYVENHFQSVFLNKEKINWPTPLETFLINYAKHQSSLIKLLSYMEL